VIKINHSPQELEALPLLQLNSYTCIALPSDSGYLDLHQGVPCMNDMSSPLTYYSQLCYYKKDCLLFQKLC